MRVFVLAAVAAVLGCASTRVVKRDGCFVKQTSGAFGKTHEEIGPCVRAQPEWADDRLTRLVQECVAQGDYRWQAVALDAWSRGQPLPPQEPAEKLQETCMRQGAAALVSENEQLKARVDEVAGERDAIKLDGEQAQAKLRDAQDRLIDYLGEAAQKPAGSAVATATSTSDGKATTDAGLSQRGESGATLLPAGTGSTQAPPDALRSAVAKVRSGRPAAAYPPRTSARRGAAPGACRSAEAAPCDADAGAKADGEVPSRATGAAGAP